MKNVNLIDLRPSLTLINVICIANCARWCHGNFHFVLLIHICEFTPSTEIMNCLANTACWPNIGSHFLNQHIGPTPRVF